MAMVSAPRLWVPGLAHKARLDRVGATHLSAGAGVTGEGVIDHLLSPQLDRIGIAGTKIDQVALKPPFGGPEQMLAYLGRYTHRLAISSSRLLS